MEKRTGDAGCDIWVWERVIGGMGVTGTRGRVLE